MKIGLLGAGLIGSEHAAGLRDLAERRLVDASLEAVFDPDAARAETARQRFGFRRACATETEAIEACDAVFVTSPTGSHRRLVEQAAAAGRAVFCEKPLARDLEEALAIAAAVQSAGVPAQIGLILRTSPAYGLARERCRVPELGRLMAVAFRDDQFFPIQGRYASTWRAERGQAGGGTFIEHSIHDVDLMRWMLGDLVEVRAVMTEYAGYQGIEDLALVSARFATGGWVNFLSLWHQILSRPSTRYLEIFFERGRVAVADEVFGPVEIDTPEGRERIEPPEVARWYLEHNPDLQPLGLQLASPQEVEDYRFLRALAEGRRPEPDLQEAVAAHQVVEAAYRAASTGRPVPLPLDSALSLSV